ncbi:MAG: acetyltransferase [Streptomyces oryziradicis]|nr:acetyltransferase [Actinacidiphila oryziradicis]
MTPMDLPPDVPRLRAGDRFALRPWQLSDLGLVREASDDDYIPQITTIPYPYTDAAGTAFVERQWQRPVTGAGYPFVIVRTEDSGPVPVGSVGLWLRDHAQGRASVGYWVVNSARGQGAAAAALSAVTSWGLGELRIPRLELYAEPWNTASLRTAERAGFEREGLLRSWQRVGAERRDMFMYSMIRTPR